MSEYNNQRYYWIKLTDRFMTSDTVDFLMEQKDGANYVVLYQMLCLKSINQNGELARRIGEVIIPFDEEKIQRDCKWFSIDTVRVALNLYKRLGLIYTQDDGILKIADFDRLIGSQTISAEKKQLQIERRGGKKVEKIPPDKDIREKDKEIDTDKEIDKNKKENKKRKNDFSFYVSSIISYLNEKLGTRYKNKSQQTVKHIIARLKEGFTVEDFKQVIDKKYASWSGTDMEKYLRPETLFGTKFESYLNEKESKAASDRNELKRIASEYDDLEG